METVATQTNRRNPDLSLIEAECQDLLDLSEEMRRARFTGFAQRLARKVRIIAGAVERYSTKEVL